MSKPAATVQAEIEKIYTKRKRLTAAEENLNSLESGRALVLTHSLSPNTGYEMQKAKGHLIDDYAKTISKLRAEINTLEQAVIKRMKQEGWQECVFQGLAIADPDNRNHTIKIEVGLKNSELVFQG